MDLKEQMATRESSGPISAEQQLQALGIKLPVLPESFGADVEAMQTGNLLFLWAGLSLEYPDRVLSSEDKQVELIQSEKDQCPKKSTINAAAFWALWP